MNLVVKILALLVANLVGFLTPPFCFVLSMRLDLLDLSDPNFNTEEFRTYFMHSSYVTWAVCAVFSLAFLFLKGKEKYFFLLAPVVITFGYGLSVILGFFGA